MIVDGEKLKWQDIEKYMDRFDSENDLLVKYRVFNGVEHLVINRDNLLLMSSLLLDVSIHEIIYYKDIVSICSQRKGYRNE